MNRFFNTVGGVWQLARLAWVTRFRFRGPYWKWRFHTAFGRGLPGSRLEMIEAALEYGRWIHQMKRSE